MSRSLFSQLFTPSNRKTRRDRQTKLKLAKHGFKPQVEGMELRIVPAVLDISQSGFLGEIWCLCQQVQHQHRYRRHQSLPASADSRRRTGLQHRRQQYDHRRSIEVTKTFWSAA